MEKLNLGCGPQVVEDWVNVDYSFGARLTKIPFFYLINKQLKLFDILWDKRIFIHDLNKKFPWMDNSIDIVYSSHTLEHFSKLEGRIFLSECYRVIRPNGIIRLVVPDLQELVNQYITGELKADNFVEKLGVLYIPHKNKIKNLFSPFIQFPHKCMYDTQTLIEVLNEIGFSATSKKPFESNINDIEKIELDIRIKNSTIVEARKSL